MSRLEPRNREEAFTYQFEDDVRVLRCLSMQDEEAFQKGLATLETHIAAYRSIRLKNKVDKAKKKSKEQQEYMKKHFPSLYK